MEACIIHIRVGMIGCLMLRSDRISYRWYAIALAAVRHRTGGP